MKTLKKVKEVLYDRASFIFDNFKLPFFEYEKYRDGVADSKWREELNSENEKNRNTYSIDKLNAAIRLAQALYGKVPVSSSVIMNILSMIG